MTFSLCFHFPLMSFLPSHSQAPPPEPSPLIKQDSDALLVAELAAAEAKIAELNARVAELNARVAEIKRLQALKSSGKKSPAPRRHSSSGSSKKGSLPYDSEGKALLKDLLKYIDTHKIPIDKGGDPESPLRVKDDADAERAVIDAFAVNHYKAETITKDKAGSPIVGLITTAPIETSALFKFMDGMKL